MHTNILPFPTAPKPVRKPAPTRLRDNVIQLSEWRERTRVRRTRHGVFFVSNVLEFAGGAA